MKRLISFVFIIILSCSISDVFGQNPEPLELIDGYFQAGDRRPFHLTHELIDFNGQVILPDDIIHFWYTVSIRPGEQNPCDDLTSVGCIASLNFVSLKDANNLIYYAKDSTRLSNGKFEIAYGFIMDQTKTPKGPGIFIFTVEKYGKMIFLHQTLVEIK